MKNTQRQRPKLASTQSGFTLIEIMVVVIIIGLLSAMILPNIFGNQIKAFRVKTKSDISTMSQALGMYRLDNFTYPSTSEGLNALSTNPGKQSWTGPYLKRVPKDPWGNAYQYQYPGTHNSDSFDLMSFGPDGTAGGEGDNADIGNWGTGK